MAPPCESADVLDRFLRDMEALDHVQQPPSGCKTAIATSVPKKRALEVASVAHKPLTMTSNKKRGTPSWIRTRNELQALRQQAEAMETRMQYLKMKKEPFTGSRSTVGAQKRKSRALVERQRRQDAQQENKRLRTQLKLHEKQSQAFQTALTLAEYQQKQLLDSSVAFVKALSVQRGAGLQLRPCSTQVFDMLERRTDARLYEVQQAFEVMQEPMTSVDTDMVQTYTNKNDRELGSVEFSRLELLPYDERAISNTLWSFIELGKFPDGERSIVVRRTEDGYAMTTRVTVQIERGGVFTIDSHSVVKRFMVDEGFAVLAESCSNWTATFADASTWSHRTREGGCFVLRDYTSNGGPLSGICQSRSVVRLHPSQGARECSLSSKSTIKEVLIPSYRQLVDARHQFVQNSMLDMMLARKH